MVATAISARVVAKSIMVGLTGKNGQGCERVRGKAFSCLPDPERFPTSRFVLVLVRIGTDPYLARPKLSPPYVIQGVISTKANFQGQRRNVGMGVFNAVRAPSHRLQHFGGVERAMVMHEDRWVRAAGTGPGRQV